jgi:hypothetical protein
MTIEQSQQTVWTRAVISVGRTKSAQPSSLPTAVSADSFRGRLFRHDDFSVGKPLKSTRHRFQLNYVYKEIPTKDV